MGQRNRKKVSDYIERVNNLQGNNDYTIMLASSTGHESALLVGKNKAYTFNSPEPGKPYEWREFKNWRSAIATLPDSADIYTLQTNHLIQQHGYGQQPQYGQNNWGNQINGTNPLNHQYPQQNYQPMIDQPYYQGQQFYPYYQQQYIPAAGYQQPIY